jgi:hypothetical protein
MGKTGFATDFLGMRVEAVSRTEKGERIDPLDSRFQGRYATHMVSRRSGFSFGHELLSFHTQ